MATAKKRPTKRAASASSIDNATETLEKLMKLAGVVGALAMAPGPVIEWATKLRESGKFTGHLPNLSDRVGQKGLERRLEGVRQAVDSAFDEGSEAHRGFADEIDRLRVALEAAGSMPLVRRHATHSKVDSRLDAIERALIDAILPSE